MNKIFSAITFVGLLIIVSPTYAWNISMCNHTGQDIAGGWVKHHGTESDKYILLNHLPSHKCTPPITGHTWTNQVDSWSVLVYTDTGNTYQINNKHCGIEPEDYNGHTVVYVFAKDYGTGDPKFIEIRPPNSSDCYEDF